MPMPRALRWSWGEGLFVVSEVPLYILEQNTANAFNFGARHIPSRDLSFRRIRQGWVCNFRGENKALKRINLDVLCLLPT